MRKPNSKQEHASFFVVALLIVGILLFILPLGILTAIMGIIFSIASIIMGVILMMKGNFDLSFLFSKINKEEK